MEIVRSVIRWGNGAGVLLPKEWLGNQAKITLIERTLEIKKEIFDILEYYLEEVLGIYLAGSYARNETTERSDVDVLVITNNTNKKIKSGKYDLLLISIEEVKKTLERNILPLLPMLKEAKVLLNSRLIEELKKASLTKKNLKFHLETTKSALNMNKAFIEFSKEEGSLIPDSTAYSLILRLRECYIVDCLIKNKFWSNEEFIKLIKKICGNIKAYEAYLRVKDDKKTKKELSIKDAEKLYNYIKKKIKEQEKWVKKRR